MYMYFVISQNQSNQLISKLTVLSPQLYEGGI